MNNGFMVTILKLNNNLCSGSVQMSYHRKSMSKLEPCQVNADYFFDCTASPASVQFRHMQLHVTFGCSQNWKWRSKERDYTTSRLFRVMRRASWRPFKNLRSRTALRCGSTAGSVWFNETGTTSKDATAGMTKDSINEEIWTRLGYFSDTPCMSTSKWSFADKETTIQEILQRKTCSVWLCVWCTYFVTWMASDSYFLKMKPISVLPSMENTTQRHDFVPPLDGITGDMIVTAH